jgi:hypothetical protein
VTRFRAALAIDGANTQALSGLAWIRATASDPALRDASEAVALAERSVAGAPSVATLDALAAAYASAGRFDEAVKAARSGVDLAVAAGQQEVAAQFRLRLQLYQQRKPFRQ